MIDFATGTVVYDQFVKPAKPILDYLTKYVLFYSRLSISRQRSLIEGGLELQRRHLAM